MDCERERVWRALPKVALPAWELIVRQAVLLGVFDAGGVGGKVANCDLGLKWVALPDGDVLRDEVVGGDEFVVHGERERHASDQGLGHGCGAVWTVCVPLG